MIINLKNLIKNDIEYINFLDSIDLSKSYPDINKVNYNVNASITKTSNENFLFEGRVDAILNVNCDLCLRPFEFKLCFDINEVLTSSEEQRDETYRIIDNKIDLNPIVKTDLLLNIPMQMICSKDCKGLCSVCGQNLNDGDCKCEHNYIDPRFEKLRTLFDSKEV